MEENPTLIALASIRTPNQGSDREGPLYLYKVNKKLGMAGHAYESL